VVLMLMQAAVEGRIGAARHPLASKIFFSSGKNIFLFANHDSRLLSRGPAPVRPGHTPCGEHA
jgi:hypothetical protein